MTGSPYLVISNHILPIVWFVIFWRENHLLHLHRHQRLRFLRVPEWNNFFRIHIVHDTTHQQLVRPASWQWASIGFEEFFLEVVSFRIMKSDFMDRPWHCIPNQMNATVFIKRCTAHVRSFSWWCHAEIPAMRPKMKKTVMRPKTKISLFYKSRAQNKMA